MMKGNMRKEKVLMKSVLTLALVLLFGLFVQNFSMISHAATGTITKASVNVRKEPSTSSTIVASLKQGNTVTVNSKTKGADEKVWYQIAVDANTVGYVRSDLMTVSGDVPEEGGGTTTPENPETHTPTVAVTPVQPLSATITGSEAVRVRWDAVIAADNIVAQLESGTAVTVTGQATDAEGNIWYQVTYTSQGTEGQGFVRADYLTLSGTVTPADGSQPENPPADNPGQENPQDEEAPYYVVYESNLEGTQDWWLIDRYGGTNGTGTRYSAKELIDFSVKYKDERAQLKKSINTQRIFIVVLVILLLAVVFAALLLFFKMKDMSDAAYFSAVEKETMRERKASRGDRGREAQSGVRKKSPSPGENQKGVEARLQGQGSAAGRPSGAQGRPVPQGGQSRSVSSQGQPRPVSSQGQSRPMSSQGQPRPVSSQQTQGRPVSSQGQARPVASQGGQPRPVASQPGMQSRTAAPNSQARQNAQQVMRQAQGQTSGQARPATARPQGSAARPAAQQTARPQPRPAQQASSRPVNITNDEDEDLEFAYLHNWDGDENS